MTILAQLAPHDLAQYANVIAAGLAILVVAVLSCLIMVRGVNSLQMRRILPEQLVATLKRVGFGIVSVTAVLLILQVSGILQSVVAAVTGTLALLAIGFVAVWSVLSNTLCSLILMVMRPYRVGDSLSLPPDDLCGKVVNFNLIFTTLETEDGCLLQVPNNIFFQRPVVKKVGKWRIGLADQLYESTNATGEPRRDDADSDANRRAA